MNESLSLFKKTHWEMDKDERTNGDGGGWMNKGWMRYAWKKLSVTHNMRTNIYMRLLMLFILEGWKLRLLLYWDVCMYIVVYISDWIAGHMHLFSSCFDTREGQSHWNAPVTHNFNVSRKAKAYDLKPIAASASSSTTPPPQMRRRNRWRANKPKSSFRRKAKAHIDAGFKANTTSCLRCLMSITLQTPSTPSPSPQRESANRTSVFVSQNSS